MRRVASITVVPAGTFTSRSLIFSVTSFCSVISFRLGPLTRARLTLEPVYREPNYRPTLSTNQRFCRLVCAAAVQVILKFVAPLGDDADRRQRRGVAER